MVLLLWPGLQQQCVWPNHPWVCCDWLLQKLVHKALVVTQVVSTHKSVVALRWWQQVCCLSVHTLPITVTVTIYQLEAATAQPCRDCCCECVCVTCKQWDEMTGCCKCWAPCHELSSNVVHLLSQWSRNSCHASL